MTTTDLVAALAVGLAIDVALVVAAVAVSWAVVRRVRRIGVRRLGRAVVALVAGSVVAVARLFVFDKDDVARLKNVFVSEGCDDVGERPRSSLFSSVGSMWHPSSESPDHSWTDLDR